MHGQFVLVEHPAHALPDAEDQAPVEDADRGQFLLDDGLEPLDVGQFTQPHRYEQIGGPGDRQHRPHRRQPTEVGADPDGRLAFLVNHEMVELEGLDDSDVSDLRSMVERHHELTGSPVANRILEGWTEEATRFRKVMPKDYRRVLTVLREAERDGLTEEQTMVRVMEAAHG